MPYWGYNSGPSLIRNQTILLAFNVFNKISNLVLIVILGVTLEAVEQTLFCLEITLRIIKFAHTLTP